MFSAKKLDAEGSKPDRKYRVNNKSESLHILYYLDTIKDIHGTKNRWLWYTPSTHSTTMGLSYQDSLAPISLCAGMPAHVHTIECTSERLQLVSTGSGRQWHIWVCVQTNVYMCTQDRGWNMFSIGVCKQAQINQVWQYFHLETIFSNMSHILKNRFRCLELVQNSC